MSTPNSEPLRVSKREFVLWATQTCLLFGCEETTAMLVGLAFAQDHKLDDARRMP